MASGPDLPGDGSDPRESIWMETGVETAHDRVPEDGVTVDTAIVGGGIVGLTAARELVDAGRTVAVVEKSRIASGVTAHSTAKLTSQHGLVYDHLVDNFGERRARQYARANETAIDHVENRIDEWGIDAEFRRTDSYTYRTGSGARERIEDEVGAAKRVGLPATLVEDVDIPREVPAAVKFTDQGAFNPRTYLLGLAAGIPGEDSFVFERTTAEDIDRGRRCRVRTDSGTVTADDVVVASHFPFYDHGAYFARLSPKRSYVLAARLSEDVPEGMYYRDESPYFSVRPHPTGDESMVLVGGQDHRTGHGHGEMDHYRKLEREARDTFAVEEITHRWSTQDFKSVDKVPFVGQLAPQTSNVYVATGFGGWGLSNGVAAGILLADLVRDRTNDWADVYDPARLKPLTSAGEFLEHNVHAGSHFIEDRLGIGTGSMEPPLSWGEARVVDDDDIEEGPVAVYRDEDGDLHAVSAVCTHMGCNVQWNDAERSWDCPCHGSRFGVDGSVIDGPAVDGLSERDLRELKRTPDAQSR
jgi:glycine/D-amino acid oxidase-like deaminating enzyme/nitrite reductase/ring-hydroxylating ferredoxin subunit